MVQSCQRLARTIRCLFFFLLIYLFFVYLFHCDVVCLDFRLMESSSTRDPQTPARKQTVSPAPWEANRSGEPPDL